MFNKFDFDIENIKRDFQIENMKINASDIEMLRKYNNKEITMNDIITSIKQEYSNNERRTLWDWRFCILLWRNKNYLKDDTREELVKDLAYYLAELNVLHPFREGNGRTIREFIRELAYKNSFLLDLQKVEPSEVYEASLKSVVDTTELEDVIDKCLIKI